MPVPATHPIDRAKRKLARGHDHRELLEREIASFFETEPQIAIIEKDDQGIGRVCLRDGIVLPAHWTGIVGDVLQNFRSCLDHLAYVCALRKKPKPGEAVYFPIHRNEKSWTVYIAEQRGVSNRRTVGADAFALMEACQPHNDTTGAAPEVHPLWVLSELAKIDRHRTHHITVIQAGNATFHTFGPLPQRGNCLRLPDGEFWLAVGPRVDDPDDSPYSFSGPQSAKPQQYGWTKLSVAFDPTGDIAAGFDIVESLAAIEEAIAHEVFPLFEDLFKPGFKWAGSLE